MKYTNDAISLIWFGPYVSPNFEWEFKDYFVQDMHYSTAQVYILESMKDLHALL